MGAASGEPCAVLVESDARAVQLEPTWHDPAM